MYHENFLNILFVNLGVTLAGDVGQAAIMNGQYPLSNVPLPRGLWNDTICPREYILEPHPNSNQEIFRKDASWSYLTEAEIRGGMDGKNFKTNTTSNK